MKRTLPALLCGLVLAALTRSASGLIIIPTFDASITNDANAAAMMGAISNAMHVFETNVTENVTVKILYISDPATGLGASSTWGNYYTYSNYLAGLRSHATSASDTNALSKLTNSTLDPVLNTNKIYVNSALARRMGLRSTYGPDGYDSTIHLNTTLMNFTRPPADPDKYDMAQTAEHEMDEVLGTPSNLPDDMTTPAPIDLFRYTTNLARMFTTSGDNAYFSADGTNLIARFNMNSGGDYSDWWSYDDVWAPPGHTPVPQVQDAYSTSGKTIDLGPSELAMLDVIGWTIATPSAVSSPALLITRSAVNQYTITWPANASPFILQETTNIVSGPWVSSASGTANPAVVTSASSDKFYRLYLAASPGVVQPNVAPFNLADGPDQLRTRKIPAPKR